MTSSNHSSERKTQEKSPTVGHQNPPTTGQWHHRKFTNKCRIFARQRCFQVFNLFNVPREHTKTASRRNSTYHVTHVPTYGSTTTPLQSLQARISKLAPEPVLGLPASHVSMLAPPMPARQHDNMSARDAAQAYFSVSVWQHLSTSERRSLSAKCFENCTGTCPRHLLPTLLGNLLRNLLRSAPKSIVGLNPLGCVAGE